MDTNLKFMYEDIHFSCISLTYLIIAAKQIDLFDIKQKIFEQKLIDKNFALKNYFLILTFSSENVCQFRLILLTVSGVSLSL